MQLRLFPLRKRLLPFLRVDATISNQAFSDRRWNIFPGLNYNKANNALLNCFRKSDIDAQVKFPLKVMERAEVTCYWCNSLLVHVLKFFRILAGRCGSVVVLR